MYLPHLVEATMIQSGFLSARPESRWMSISYHRCYWLNTVCFCQRATLLCFSWVYDLKMDSFQPLFGGRSTLLVVYLSLPWQLQMRTLMLDSWSQMSLSYHQRSPSHPTAPSDWRWGAIIADCWVRAGSTCCTEALQMLRSRPYLLLSRFRTLICLATDFVRVVDFTRVELIARLFLRSSSWTTLQSLCACWCAVDSNSL